jgi:Inner membrane protein CreD
VLQVQSANRARELLRLHFHPHRPKQAVAGFEANPGRTYDWYVLPERLEISVDLQVQDVHRRLGLYDVPVYIARIRAKGQFDLPHEIARLTRGGSSLHLHLEQARFLLPIQDPRGLRGLTSGTEELLNFEPSSGFPIPVLAAPLSIPAESATGPHKFDLSHDAGGITQILLSHRDDVADADKYAREFGARVCVHQDDCSAAPYATDLLEGRSQQTIAPGVRALPMPGHTRGSVVYLRMSACSSRVIRSPGPHASAI